MEKQITVLLISLFVFTGCKTSSDLLLFSSNRDGNSNIYLMQSDGTKLEQITDENAEEWGPVWMNENEISFLRQDVDQISIIRHNLQTGQRSKIEHPENCRLDDKNIIYSKTTDHHLYTCKGEIYLVDRKLNSTKNLTSEISGSANYMAWGKHENEITFTSNHEGNNEIYLLDLESKRLQNLTKDDSNENSDSIDLNFSGLLPGFYLVKVEIGGKIGSFKVLKVR